MTVAASMLSAFGFALALLAAAVMGLAMQRGATCTVAAMDELVRQRRAGRLLAIAEAALWVGAGLVVARAAGWMPSLPDPPALTLWTVAGSVLLGLGALINGACLFGAVARLGTGDWAFAATPLGFYLGCWAMPAWLLPQAVSSPNPAIDGRLPEASWIVWLVALAALLRLGAGTWRHVRRAGWLAPPTPHASTAAIGLAFLALLLLAGAWSYTDLLTELARAMVLGDRTLAPRVALAIALLAGALYGGWLNGLWQRRAPTARALLRCLAGGSMLGCGSVLVPGGNDSLILLGLPLLWPHAWASVAVMCAVVGSVIWVRRWR